MTEALPTLTAADFHPCGHNRRHHDGGECSRCLAARGPKGFNVSQADVFRAIYDLTCEFGLPPTTREVGAHMGFRSTNATAEHFVKLEAWGLLRRPGGFRANFITPAGAELLGVPWSHVAPMGSPRLVVSP